MLDSLRSAFKVTELRNKVLFTLMMFLVFRLGVHVPVPGVNVDALQNLLQGQLFGVFDVISGGAFRRLSIFAMSITPYINASIIMSLLQIVIPRLEQLAKEGESGRKVIAQYTRYGAVLLGLIQAIGMCVALGRQGVFINPGVGTYTVAILSLTAGTALLMWIGEKITENGIGNGISLIIFAGIVSRLPSGVASMGEQVSAGVISVGSILLLLALGLLIIAGVVAVNEGQRRISVQYAKRVMGRKVYGGQSTHIPLKVNQAGVIPIIFAMSILLFPAQIAQWINHPWARAVESALSFGTAINSVIYFVVIIFFTYFYTAIVFNPMDVADNLKKYGGFVPGLRPGRSTGEYIARVSSRLTLAGAVFLALIAILPNFMIAVTGISTLYFGGTALLIVVGVALDTMKQFESYLLMRHYEGFMK
ncbi:MAG: preprotein translocase subunit SecY [Syntrophaceticus sp.]|jgi:preprotein translocase subunit SecY|nr:preprotein translocase subunit SecY [Syntrophaceticus sp.]MDD3314114.1 preprotein translocase subunit SecY [Syntrophaceticus sp.]MDD4360244.1 preprotein translocase subunit SecY [Syntrophaceticus sp.]MDD4782177.1 preprotein translocase subunit SecY [Syntrophaceticus sp.]